MSLKVFDLFVKQFKSFEMNRLECKEKFIFLDKDDRVYQDQSCMICQGGCRVSHFPFTRDEDPSYYSAVITGDSAVSVLL